MSAKDDIDPFALHIRNGTRESWCDGLACNAGIKSCRAFECYAWQASCHANTQRRVVTDKSALQYYVPFELRCDMGREEEIGRDEGKVCLSE